MEKKRWNAFEPMVKKKIREALSLKKETNFELPLGTYVFVMNHGGLAHVAREDKRGLRTVPQL